MLCLWCSTPPAPGLAEPTRRATACSPKMGLACSSFLKPRSTRGMLNPEAAASPRTQATIDPHWDCCKRSKQDKAPQEEAPPARRQGVRTQQNRHSSGLQSSDNIQEAGQRTRRRCSQSHTLIPDSIHVVPSCRQAKARREEQRLRRVADKAAVDAKAKEERAAKRAEVAARRKAATAPGRDICIDVVRTCGLLEMLRLAITSDASQSGRCAAPPPALQIAIEFADRQLRYNACGHACVG